MADSAPCCKSIFKAGKKKKPMVVLDIFYPKKAKPSLEPLASIYFAFYWPELCQ